MSAVNTFSDYCVHEKDAGRPVDIEAMRPHVQPMVDTLRSDMENGRDYNGIPLLVWLLLNMADFHLGRIDIETFIENCEKLRQEAMSADPRLRLIVVSDIDVTYLTYVYKYSRYGAEKIGELCRKRLDESLPQLLQTAKMVNDIQFNSIPMKYITCASYTSRFSDFAEAVLDLSVYSDKPLFIHTAMVREMSRAIFDYMTERTPEFFNGVAGRDTAYIREHREEMRALLDDCCMYHDLGKFWMLDITDNSMRRLFFE